MKIIYKNQTKEFKNSSTCTAIEYPLNDPTINGAVIIINGRYPEKGKAYNEVSKEMVYVIKGSGKVVVENKEIILNEGDLVLIEPNEKFYWNGNMTLFMPCTPAWNPSQYKEVEQ